jgi:hypothetical protein
MHMAKDVEEELKEEDDDGDRTMGKRFLGRTDSSRFGSKSRSSYNLNSYRSNNNTNWANPNKKNGPTSPNSNSTSSMSYTGRKSDNDRKSGATERWRGVRSEEMEERRAKGLCFKCGWRYHL